MEKVTGIAKDRLLPTFAKVRFSKWFRSRGTDRSVGTPRSPSRCSPRASSSTRTRRSARRSSASTSATASRASCPRARCAAACRGSTPATSTSSASTRRRTSPRSLPAVEAGKSIVVPQPTCAYVLKNEYRVPRHRSRAARSPSTPSTRRSTCLNAHRKRRARHRTSTARTYGSILWQAACHYRAQQIGPEEQAADGAHRRQGADGRALLRHRRHVGAAGREPRDGEAGGEAADGAASASPDAELVAGDCQLANTAIKEDTDKRPSHPMQVMARAYGIEDDEVRSMKKLHTVRHRGHRAYERERDEFRAPHHRH